MGIYGFILTCYEAGKNKDYDYRPEQKAIFWFLTWPVSVIFLPIMLFSTLSNITKTMYKGFKRIYLKSE